MPEMKSPVYGEVLSNTEIKPGIFDIKVYAPEVSAGYAPGMFVGVYIDDNRHILPRPFGICESFPEEGAFGVVYAVVGEGTESISKWGRGKTARMLGPLGNGFSIGDESNVLIVGGGLGVPPLLGLAGRIRGNNPKTRVTASLGFKNIDKVILFDEFAAHCNETVVATEDGGFGAKGFATDYMEGRVPDVIYACGPYGMLKAVADYAGKHGILCQVSMEERMACGIGACLCCVVSGKRVCRDGPVFDSSRVDWDG